MNKTDTTFQKLRLTYLRGNPCDQSLHGQNGAKIRRSNFRSRYHDIEFGLHREHQVDHIDRTQADLGKLFIDQYRPGNRMLRQDFLDQLNQSISQ